MYDATYYKEWYKKNKQKIDASRKARMDRIMSDPKLRLEYRNKNKLWRQESLAHKAYCLTLKRRMTDEEKKEKRIKRFWSYVDIKSESECWEWKMTRYPFGYGRFVSEYAHRLAWSIKNGEIPEGMFVCHSCDNPPCCNPNHLWLGTAKQNSRDMIKKGRGRHQKLLTV